MRKTCAAPGCGEPFEAKRAAALYCGERCKKRAQRAGKSPRARLAAVPAEPEAPADPNPAPVASDGPMWRVTFAQLTTADRADTPLGQLALQHAAALDDPLRADTGSSRAALSKEYRAALAEAMRDAETEQDDLDEILESATVKLLPGGAR